jgi:RNA recognition motif-containing protein
MDINSLLSPQETIHSKPPTPVPQAPQSPRRHVPRARSGSFRPAPTSSPFSNSTITASSLPQHILSPIRTAVSSSPAISPTSGVYGATPPRGDLSSSRSSSTHNMDTLADIASMQNHQPQKSAAPMLRSKESFESQLSPSTIFPTIQAVPATSNPRSSFDIAMAEASKSTMRTNFGGTSLPEEAQQTASSLSENLQKNPYAYASHVELVTLLHQGFFAHVYPPDLVDTHGDPQTYDLLDDLRKARENMDKLFAVGEDLWLDWIKDESMLAQTMEERISVTEKCARAVQEEHGSTKLWVQYGDWVFHCYELVQDGHQQNDSSRLSQEDMIMGEAAFDRQLVLDTWKAAAYNTKWRIDDSHLVWDRYIELVMEDLKMANSKEMIDSVKLLFEDRFQYPHANWEGTFSIFSTFITEYSNHDYEHIMARTRESTLNVRLTWDARETFEIALQKAQESGDRITEYNTFVLYVEWEKAEIKEERSIFELANALYERAALRFPSDTSLWEDHAIFMIDETYKAPANASPLSMLDRATRHCPWSGSLWSQYLLSSERAGAPFTATEEIKHKATNTGLLDVGGIDEVLKVHIAWCSYLRRRAFRAESSDEDLDVAEMGIRSSIENMQELANGKHGEGSNPDPFFRLHRIYIKYLSESGSWDSAREAFRGLVDKQGDSWEFWMRFYVWEMMRWARFIQGEKSATDGLSRKTPSPQYATAVLKQALKRPNLDWPEKIMDTLTTHCEDHEDIEELQLAIVEIKRTERIIAQRRAKEAAEAADAAALAQAQAQHLNQEQVEQAEVIANGLHIGKRKREDAEIDEPSKKPKAEELDVNLAPAAPIAQKEVKRDRENASVKVQNLPDTITETRLRQFFRDCGTINSLKLLHTTAVIEFNEKEEALFAQSRDGKDLDGSTINVQLGSGSILFVTNFPPAADEAFIRGLFEKFGQIVDVRFPSLQLNTHRRFCYVEFERNDQAKAASIELDGHECDDGLKLNVKISSPEQKQSRSGAMEERREIYVRNLDWAASEEDLERLFSQYGSVESVRIPRKVNGQRMGIGFVVFSSSDEATAASTVMSEQMYKSRKLHVEISSKVSNKRQATIIVNRVERPTSQSTGEAASPSAMSATSGNAVETAGDRGSRTVALMDVPDTVNDSRIKELAEKHGGPLVKVSLRPDHQGAIIEYVDERDAGKAQLHLDGYEIVPGRTLRVGSVGEMLKEKAEVRTSRIVTGKALQSAAPIKRPAQQSGRGGGRLGQRRGGFKANGSSDSGKSNDDFRAMIAKR